MSTAATGDDATLPGTEAPLRTDEVIAQGSVIGRYVVLAKIGAGGMGAVYSAYDPKLDRKVALKLLHPAVGELRGSEDRTRLIREAQALAQLSHPNVVTVHDVGTVDRRVWMAMEFIRGQTLGAWLKAEPRPWREVLRVMIAAGEGLTAAHAAGLLHRDFKPDNVMLDASGRVRVMDFGLARAGSDTPPRTITGLTRVPADTQALTLDLTHAGALMGTPGYMSPEQLGGETADVRADQFAYCVTLWEALHGARPFEGQTVGELAARVLGGELRRPPPGTRVPGWLRRICERGLATDPERRFESMPALLGAFAREQARVRQKIGLAMVSLVVALGLGGYGYQRWDLAERRVSCEAEGASIEAVWNEEARARLRTSIVATELSYAASTADRVIPWIDREVEAWREHGTRACTLATIEDRWDAQTFDRARWCLEQRKLAIASLVELQSEADALVVRRAVHAAAALQPIAPCLDEDALRRQPPPPLPSQRPRIAELRTRLARASALADAHRHVEGLAVLDAMQEEVDEASWLPLTAATHVVRFGLQLSGADHEGAERSAALAYQEAAESGAWATAAVAASALAALVGRTLSRPAEGRLWARHAEIALAIAGDPLELGQGERLIAEAGIAFSTGDHARARELYERNLELVRASLGNGHPTVARALVNVGAANWALGSTDQAKRDFGSAREILEHELGPDHPDVATVLNNIAALEWEAGAFAEAVALYDRTLEIQTAVYGPEHTEVAATLDNLALAHGSLGHHDQALRLQERALVLWESTMGAEHPYVAVSLGILGDIEYRRGRTHEAIGAYERAVEIYDLHAGAQQHEHQIRFSLAVALVEGGGDRARALALARAARAGYRELGEGRAEEVVQIDAWLAEHAAGPEDD